MAATTRRALKPLPVVPLARVRTDQELLNRIQQNVDDATRDTRAHPQVKGKKITVAMPATGSVTVAHGLGRKPEGYHQQSASGTTNPSYRETSRDSRFLVFESTAACTVDLWVF